MPQVADSPPDIICGTNTDALRSSGMHLRWSAATHQGLRRNSNQDCFRILGPVFVVCDGMGGQNGGETASAVAADVIVATGAEPQLALTDLEQSIAAANKAVLAVSSEQPELQGLGTTVVALMILQADNTEWIVGCNVGDSRAYVAQAGVVKQLSYDHSVVQELLDQGSITPEQAPSHKQRSVLTSVVGMAETPEPYCWRIHPQPGMRFMLCTDGIHRTIGNDSVAELLKVGTPMDAVSNLCGESLAQGAPDNLALIVIDVVAPTSEEIDIDITLERPTRIGGR